MNALQEYKCPSCGGAIHFDSSLQKMKCPYCDSEFDMENLKAYDEILNNQSNDSMNWNMTENSQWKDGEQDGLSTYICNSCGGEIIGDENMAASSCPYCDNPIVVMGKFSGSLRPDYVIPFKLDKKDAKAALNKHYSGKRLLPKVFKDKNHIDEIKGIYVPFWLCDADVAATVHYKATKNRTWSDSNYNYTETSYYSLVRSGNVGFEKVPVDASKKIEDALMESVEPFKFEDAVEFQTAYLAGYLAEKYDVDLNECIERANERIRKSTESAFAQTTKNYMTVNAEKSNIYFNNGSAKYALYPIWLLNTTWQGKKYIFAMNGQTGKIVGDLPLDKSAYKKWLFGLFFGISAIVYAISYFVWFIK